MNQPLPVDLRDLYMLIGERETIRYLQQERIACLETQLREAQAKILTLETEIQRGKLGEPNPNDAV